MALKLYGFWRSLATCRVRIVLALKGLQAEEVSVNLIKGEQHDAEFKAVNPQSMVPALLDGSDDTPLFESLAIMEYLDESYPEPPLLPRDPRERARVRGLAQIIACDGHPLFVPRVRNYLQNELSLDENGINRWCQHWVDESLRSVEARLANESDTGKFCHGDTPSLADICVVSQVFGARIFNCDFTAVPTVMRVFNECLKLEAFDASQPLKQPGAPKNP